MYVLLRSRAENICEYMPGNWHRINCRYRGKNSETDSLL